MLNKKKATSFPMCCSGIANHLTNAEKEHLKKSFPAFMDCAENIKQNTFYSSHSVIPSFIYTNIENLHLSSKVMEKRKRKQINEFTRT